MLQTREAGAIPNPQSGCDKDFEEVPIRIPSGIPINDLDGI